MNAARTQLGDALRAQLPPEWEIIDEARTIDQKTHPVVMLERTSVAKAPNAKGAWWITFTVHTISPIVGKYSADDALDDCLDATLQALDSISWCNWDTATRSVFLEQYPSFQTIVHTVTER